MNNLNMDLELLNELVETPGVPGREEQVAHLIHAHLPEKKTTVVHDQLGNLVAHIPGPGKRVMLVAHMDEVGFIVQRILPNGFLKVERMGGASLLALPGSRLSLWTSNSCLPAQVGVLPQHLSSNEPLELSKVFVDIGTSSIQETMSKGVLPGNVLTWESPLRSLSQTMISAKALDDRLGCFILIQLAGLLHPDDLGCDLYLAFIVQEENMLLGGIPAVNTFSPDVLIGIDGTLSFDTPDLEGLQSDLRLGEGPAIKWMDAIRGKLAGFVPDQKLAHNILDIAKESAIPLQNEIVVGLSTAISPLMYAGKGAASLALSIPLRYHHTPIETADLRDVMNMITLLKNLVYNHF
ncbi:MAG: M42 family metallopeptidase [Chloroflexi bacterium]|nr:M42 family metallopeptidase [Chloroflexota bacterium]